MSHTKIAINGFEEYTATSSAATTAPSLMPLKQKFYLQGNNRL
ncbi:hypothetical protein QFZ51_001255 [Chitinophaga sp. W3I9]